MCKFTREIINSRRENIWVITCFWGASGFFVGPVDFLIHWPPGPVVATVQCQGLYLHGVGPIHFITPIVLLTWTTPAPHIQHSTFQSLSTLPSHQSHFDHLCCIIERCEGTPKLLTSVMVTTVFVHYSWFTRGFAKLHKFATSEITLQEGLTWKKIHWKIVPK